MDTSAHLGMNFLLRFCVLCESFPDCLDGEDYTKRPVLCSTHSYHCNYPPSSQNSNWNALFKVSGINCDKVTHQQRQQVQQKLADTGLDLMHSERFIGYASNGQKQMNGNPVSLKHLRTHEPPELLVSRLLLEINNLIIVDLTYAVYIHAHISLLHTYIYSEF